MSEAFSISHDESREMVLALQALEMAGSQGHELFGLPASNLSLALCEQDPAG